MIIVCQLSNTINAIIRNRMHTHPITHFARIRVRIPWGEPQTPFIF